MIPHITRHSTAPAPGAPVPPETGADSPSGASAIRRTTGSVPDGRTCSQRLCSGHSIRRTVGIVQLPSGSGVPQRGVGRGKRFRGGTRPSPSRSRTAGSSRTRSDRGTSGASARYCIRRAVPAGASRVWCSAGTMTPPLPSPAHHRAPPPASSPRRCSRPPPSATPGSRDGAPHPRPRGSSTGSSPPGRARAAAPHPRQARASGPHPARVPRSSTSESRSASGSTAKPMPALLLRTSCAQRRQVRRGGLGGRGGNGRAAQSQSSGPRSRGAPGAGGNQHAARAVDGVQCNPDAGPPNRPHVDEWQLQDPPNVPLNGLPLPAIPSRSHPTSRAPGRPPSTASGSAASAPAGGRSLP